MQNSSNPAIKKLRKQAQESVGFGAQNPASYGGIGIKIGFFLLLTLVSAIVFVLLLPNMVNNGSFAVLLAVAAIVALISGFVAAFVPKTIPVAGSIYCIAEGALIGVISALFEAAIQGIVLMALLATVFTLGIICLLYFTGVVKVGSGFRRVLMVSLLAIIFSQLVFFLLSLFVPSIYAAFYNNFGLQLVVSAIMIVVASMSIFVDLDNMAVVVENGLDKKYEWFAAYGLIVTLIWLYIEFLRLIAIIASNRTQN